MKKILILSALFLAISANGYAASQRYVEGEILVKYKPVTKNQNTKTLRRIGAKEIGRFNINNVHHIKLPKGLSVKNAIREILKDPNILYAEPNYIFHINKMPNDLMFFTQWGLHNTGAYTGTGIADIDIDAPEAWNITTGSAETVVAVLDTGIDYTHPDLRDNIWINTGEIPDNGIDDDGNGYIDDICGWDFVNNDNDPMDDNNHGTFTSGVIGASGNNNIGITGVCWNVKIMPLKVLDDEGSGDLASILQALDYAIRNGARISNNSYGIHMAYADRPLALQDAINTANENNHLFIASAGNAGYDNDIIYPPEGSNISGPNYPSSFDSPNIIAVAASNYWDRLANQFEDNWDSNYGRTSVDLAAPGDFIWTTAPFNLYQPVSGTSVASPFIAGACALLWTNHPELTNLQIKEMLLGGVDPIQPTLGRTTLTGGRLNIFKALNQIPQPPSAPTGLWAKWILNEIRLGWNANTEPDLAGYNIYLKRTMVDRYLGTSYHTYIKLNTGLVQTNSYSYPESDNRVNTYVVTSVDRYGNESAYSNEARSYPIFVDPMFLSNPVTKHKANK